jgi:hypothetical protein
MSAVRYCSHYLTPVANLPPVSTTPAVPVAKFAAGCKFATGVFGTGVVDTGGAPSLANISMNFRGFGEDYS